MQEPQNQQQFAIIPALFVHLRELPTYFAFGGQNPLRNSSSSQALNTKITTLHNPIGVVVKIMVPFGVP